MAPKRTKKQSDLEVTSLKKSTKLTKAPNKTPVKKAVKRLKRVGIKAASPDGQNKLQDATGKLPLFDSWSPPASDRSLRDKVVDGKPYFQYCRVVDIKRLGNKLPEDLNEKLEWDWLEFPAMVLMLWLIVQYSDSAELIGKDDIGMWPIDRLIEWPTSAASVVDKQGFAATYQHSLQVGSKTRADD